VTKTARRPSSIPPTATATRSGADDSHGPSGTRRRGRRPHPRPAPPRETFLQRNRGAILGVALIVGVTILGGFVFLSATAPTYACSTVWQAPSPDPDPSVLGAPEDDMGRTHVTLGQFVRYTYCPPASGSHVNLTGQGPIAARFYGPDDTAGPQGWVHNLEHGGLVVLYSCQDGCPSQSDLDRLKALTQTLPKSPICGWSPGQIGPVIARFDQMAEPFAALLWDRVLYQQHLDIDQVVTFFTSEAERTNPEPLCPSPSPSTTPTPSASPATSPSPGTSASPATSPSPAASPSPS